MPQDIEHRLLQQLAESIKPKEKMPLLEWTQKFRRTEKGARFSFVQRPYLRQIYNDDSQIMAIKKATQVGITEYGISRALHFAIESAPVTIIYTMPTASDIRDLVAARLNPSLSKSPLIREHIGRVDSISVKEIAGSFLYLRGSFTSREAMSVPADLLLHDEVDYSNQNILSQYAERLTASKYKQKVSFSKPSVPFFGIDALFEESDQHEWQVQCQKCGWTGLPTMENIDVARKELSCPGCGKNLDRKKGLWVAAYPDRDIRGYHVDQLTSDFITIESIIGKWQGPEAYSKSDFENQVRGMASATGIGVVNRGVILRQCFNEPVEKSSTGRGRYMGIDQNGRMSVVVSEVVDGKRHIVEVLELEDDVDWTEMHKMMARHDVRACVIDLRPEARLAKKFAMQYPGKVYCCEFVRSLKECYFDSAEDWLIKGSRTLILDGTAHQIQKGLTQIYPMDTSIETYIKHWERLTRSEKEDNLGRTMAQWTSSGPDHLALADCYNRLAVKITVGDMDMFSEPSSNIASTIPREGKSMLGERW